MLRLTLTPGLGPILIGRLIERFGSAAAACEATFIGLRQVSGIGEGKSRTIAEGLKESGALAAAEMELAATLQVNVVAKGGPGYPTLLGSLPDAPPVLYVKGNLAGGGEQGDSFAVGIVGSRECTQYGLEQAQRFGSSLARAGLVIVSGGARGIDSAAHRGAVSAGGRTVAVLGCGLAECYPPENADLFNQIARNGAVVSELPLRTAPQAENFPARNRIISGMSLGIVVIEAGLRSGALITAKVAAEEHGREVMAVPGRVDSRSSQGTHELLKAGGALIVTDPADVIAILETPARHQYQETHADRYGALPFLVAQADAAAKQPADGAEKKAKRPLGLSESQGKILSQLDNGARTIDELCEGTGMDAAALRRDVTLLEMQKRITREGSRFVKKRRE